MAALAHQVHIRVCLQLLTLEVRHNRLGGNNFFAQSPEALTQIRQFLGLRQGVQAVL